MKNVCKIITKTGKICKKYKKKIAIVVLPINQKKNVQFVLKIF